MSDSDRTINGISPNSNLMLGVNAVIAFDNLRNSLETSLSRLVTQGQSADARAGMILSTNIAMMGALVAALSASRAGDLTAFGVFMVVVALGLGAVSIGHVAFAAFPRTSKATETVLFFGALSSLSHADYDRQLRTMTPDAYIDDLSRQCHAVAQIVTVKFRAVRTAFILLFAAILPWMISVAAVSKNF